MINQVNSGIWLLEFNWIDINDEKFILPDYEDRRLLEQLAVNHFTEANPNAETIIEVVRAEWRRMRPDLPQTVSLNVTIAKSPVSKKTVQNKTQKPATGIKYSG